MSLMLTAQVLVARQAAVKALLRGVGMHAAANAALLMCNLQSQVKSIVSSAAALAYSPPPDLWHETFLEQLLRTYGMYDA